MSHEAANALPITDLPLLDVDMWSDEILADPFPVYRQLRALGPVVYLPRHDVYAITRFDDVKAVLQDWQTYSSAQGVGFNATLNGSIAGSLIGSDPPQHTHYRQILERPLAASELKQVREQIRVLVTGMVDEAVAKGEVEAVADLSAKLPVSLVAELVGLPEEGRDLMLEWAAAAFNALAPEHVDRVSESVEVMAGMTDYFTNPDLPSRLRRNSWASRLDEAVHAGEITREEFCTLLQMNYTLAALDTTIHAASNLLWLLSTRPETWEALRRNRTLIGRAVNEALRLEGPVQAFSRVTTAPTRLGEYEIPPGRRLLLSYAAANRDERHYPDPDVFDVHRNAADHLAFGYGEHLCLGRNLATLELTALLTELVERVEHLSLIDAERGVNNSLRGFKQLHLRLH